MESNFTRICMESAEETGAYIYPPICTSRLSFLQGVFFHFVLSEYPNQSHNFTSLNFSDVTLLFSPNQLSELDDFVSFPSYGCNLGTERERATRACQPLIWCKKEKLLIFLAVVDRCHLPDNNSYNSFLGAKASTAWKHLYIKKRKTNVCYHFFTICK